MAPQTRTPSPHDRLEEALANLHLMEPSDAALVIQRTLEQVHAEQRGRRTFSAHVGA